ncbi:hypothetical protein PEL8287_01528 [Roseovarius litorisediminis]|uniref:Inositolphosphotransferase Aur1/Ipt1 domain-containing protein n=1 Tax=Roseovarius litorisediminis TaxID=1312363 RepID=A0A1Y5S6I5_9RHOB|nr:phosphatase PAP2 family protein [Roseovarius litorisediminis]SLN32357.1 hypothetical protein PEL8287_01528 [Roseovarius litorisediminis]
MAMQLETHPRPDSSGWTLRDNPLVQAYSRNKVLFGLIAVHLLAGVGISIALSIPFKSTAVPNLLRLLTTFVPLFLAGLVCWRFIYMARHVRPAKPIHWLLGDIRNTLLEPGRMSGGVISFLGIILFASTFAFIKDTIPLINPFSWDPFFARIDRVLHGGYDPYVLVQPLFGTAAATSLINGVYNIWFFALYYCVFITCFDTSNLQRRNAFLLSFVLVWAIGGNLLAILFASGGPVYYEAFGYGDQFAPLMANLHEMSSINPLSALDLQKMLLDGYLSDGELSGISAMPSMHVTSSWLMAFLGFRYNRLFGWSMVGFAILVQLGSVHLAWHYAVDGYFGFFIALACWWAGNKLALLQD